MKTNVAQETDSWVVNTAHTATGPISWFPVPSPVLPEPWKINGQWEKGTLYSSPHRLFFVKPPS